MSCLELASRLSENYYNINPFNSTTESLGSYLNHNGILLTMCIGQTIFGGPCNLGLLSNHVSASWIRDIDTGFRIFGGAPPDEMPIGLILDPMKADIDCVYPIDGLTVTRLRRGCGVLADSPEAPSSFQRVLERYEIVKYKNEVFGKDAKWSDIDCRDFIGNVVGAGDGNIAVNNTDCSFAVAGNIPLNFTSADKFMYETWSYLMGHTVCKVTVPWVEPTFTKDDTILYSGSCVWKPSDWLGMVDTMVKVTEEYPHVLFWNEVVIAKPIALRNIVQAVFIVDGFHDDSRSDDATKEAKRLGKPLLFLHVPVGNENLKFICAETSATISWNKRTSDK